MFSITAQAGEKTSEILAKDNAASSCPCRACHSHCPRQRGKGHFSPFYMHHHFEVTNQSHHLLITPPYVILCFFVIGLLKNIYFHFFLLLLKKDNS